MLELMMLSIVGLIVAGGFTVVAGIAGVLLWRRMADANYGKPHRWIHQDVDSYVSKARRKRELKDVLADLYEGIEGPEAEPADE